VGDHQIECDLRFLGVVRQSHLIACPSNLAAKRNFGISSVYLR